MLGNCHCGKVVFEVYQKPEEATHCDCSYCSRAGWLTGFSSVMEFKLLEGSEDLSVYYFGDGNNHHFFCSHCGINTHYFNDGVDPPHYAYNMGCVEELEVGPVVSRNHTEIANNSRGTEEIPVLVGVVETSDRVGQTNPNRVK